jgi:hypothetical protein
MLAQPKTIIENLPRAGKDGICPHCSRPTRFLHTEQFPGDAPFIAYNEPVDRQKAPQVQVRKMKCTRDDCGKIIVTLIPYQKM